jgi:glycosyltransferase involved in cell wall biosynthesis
VHQDLQISARRKLISELLPRASGIVTRSAEISRLLADCGLPKDRLHPILNGADLDRFYPADAITVREELGLPVNQRIVLFVGKLVPEKNPVLLVEAFGRLCTDDRFANALLIFVGGGPLEGEINFHAERGGRIGRVLVAGRQTPETVAKFMQAADVLCVPSNEDGLPNVILEAFACGVPVVATQVGGIPEVHKGDYLGRLVPPRDTTALADALKATLDSLADRKRIYDYARQFTWKRAADQYHELLTKAAAP